MSEASENRDVTVGFMDGRIDEHENVPEPEARELEELPFTDPEVGWTSSTPTASH